MSECAAVSVSAGNTRCTSSRTSSGGIVEALVIAAAGDEAAETFEAGAESTATTVYE